MKRWLLLAGIGLVGISASAAPVHSQLFYNLCSPGSFKVCASADVSIVGNTLVFKVWNMSQSTYATASIDDYNSETGGWHTIRAVGIANIGYTLANGGATVVAEYFDGTDWTTLSKWAGAADANALQVYNTGADADQGHAEGIVGCLDPGPANKNHVSTCAPGYPTVPYVQFTISGFSSLSLAGAEFEFHGVQAAYPNCDPTDVSTGPNGPSFDDERCTENSFKGSGPPTEVVPEPITMILLGSGLLGVGGAARRRRRREALSE